MSSAPMDELFHRFQADRNPREILETRTAQIDCIVATAASDALAPKLTCPFSVAAVGGYGRRELFPYSDVDVLVLFETEADLQHSKEPVAEFLRLLWDSGLRVSQSVRTIDECVRLHDQNTELSVSLLDLRLVSEPSGPFEKLSAKLPAFYERHSALLSRRLADLARERHAKFNNTVYHLEPNVKEAPGGIRDIHLLRWLSQLSSRPAEIADSPEETEAARQFLFAVRCFIHFCTARDNNLLSFELQDEAAQSLAQSPLQPEAWMRKYYQHARRLFQCSLRALEYVDSQDQSLLRHFREWRSRLSTPDITVARERVFLRNPAEMLSSANSVLRLFTFVGRHGISLSWDTNRRVRAAAPKLKADFARRLPGWQAWREFFAQPHTALALRAMQETAILGAAIPEWEVVDGLVVRDFYHRYTVDEHTLVAIEAIDTLAKSSGSPPRFHELMLEESSPALLRIALLLHDFGKGTTPGEHTQGSVALAEPILQRLGIPQPDKETICFLIEHHLDLSSLMNSRDLSDPATARLLTSQIATQEHLRRLTLLTYADISAVNPTAMTPWRLEQLWRAYTLASEQLTRELSTDRIHHTAAIGADASFPKQLAQFLDGLPTRYLRTHTRQEIERHFALQQQSEGTGVAVDIRKEAGAYLMTVIAEDRPGLFASLCGALASFGMDIVKAEASSNSAGCALDLFRFGDPNRTLELNPGEVNRLQWTVECVVRRSVEVSDLLKRRRPVPRPNSRSKIPPSVHFNNEASDTATLIDFVGEDRPGLLYDLASAITGAGCNIDVVLIDTEAHKAIDVFYVTRDGAKLENATQARLQSTLLHIGTPA